MAWLNNIWSSDPQNVWFGGQLSLQVPDNVIENIFESNDTSAIPNILILDNSFEILGQLSGYTFESLSNLIEQLTVIIGDVNQDGLVNLLDVSPFISLLSAGTFQAEADCNGDGIVDLLDVSIFIALLSG